MTTSPAAAGSYSAPTFDGGYWTFDDDPLQYPFPQANPYAGDHEDANFCGGDLTATSTWTPDNTADTAPQVIVTQVADAYWDVRGVNGYPTASCTDGLFGDKEVDTTYMEGYYSGDSGRTNYSVQSPSGNTVTVTCSGVSATMDLNSTTPPVDDGDVGASWEVDLSPVTIALTSTKPVNGVQYGLTGQKITTNLSGIPGNFNVTKYTWSGQSGTCFKNYDPSQPNNQLTSLGSTDLSGPAKGSNTVAALNFYDSAAENLTVTCTATVLAPDGTTLNITATSPTINVLKPTVSWDIHTGYVQHVQDQSGQGGYQLRQAPGSTQAGGEAWSNAKIIVPPPFAATGGSGCIAQLATPDIEFTNDDPTKVPTNPTNKQQGLDNSFPYKGDQWDVSGVGAGSDSPALLYENLNTGGYAGWTQASDSDNFTTWVMYQPPGGVWVPLQSYDWDWSFTSQWSKDQNQWNPFRARPSQTSGDPGYKGAVTLTFPQWKLVQTNT